MTTSKRAIRAGRVTGTTYITGYNVAVQLPVELTGQYTAKTRRTCSALGRYECKAYKTERMRSR